MNALSLSVAVTFGLISLALGEQSILGQRHREDQAPELKSDGDDRGQDPIGYLNWKTKTLGGQQFWTDVRNVEGWRIQNNSETDHFRLLSPTNIRHAWGNRVHCDQQLNQMIVQKKVTPASGKVVILLHGLIRTNGSMEALATHLHERGEFTTVNFAYASTRNGVGDHALALKEVIAGLGPDVTEIHLVGHSLGNIVIRRYLADTTNKTNGTQGDARIDRIVMIAPPNQGSRIARLLKNSYLFHTIAGKSGAELSRGWKSLESTLATPLAEFGIIAGGQESEDDFSNFVLRGKDDFTVSVAETKLAGADDFLVRPWLHTTIMHQPGVLDATLSFFQNGYFDSERTRRRIADDEPQASNGPDSDSDRAPGKSTPGKVRE